MAEKYDVVDIIRCKRDGGVLQPEEIAWVIDAYTRGVVRDEQMSALAMAVFLKGMTGTEIALWTRAMIDSGETMDFSHLGRVTACLLYTSPSPRDLSTSRMPSSA